MLIITDLDKPDIYSTDMRPAEGSAVKISCIVDGQPTPTVSWTMNGSPLNTSGNSRIFLRNGDKQLNIMNLSRTDSGEYRCVAQNSRGNISSNASVLSVQRKKTFLVLSFFFSHELCRIKIIG